MAVALGTVASSNDAPLTGYTPDAGTDRLLLFSGSGEGGGGSTRDITAVTFNGISMTPSQDVVLNEQTIDAYYLLESSIPAGANDFAVTHNIGTPAGGYHYVAALFTDVDQAAPIADSSANSAGSSNQLSTSVLAVAGGYSFAHANQGRNPGTTTWTAPYVELTDYSANSSIHSSAANQESSGGASTAEATVTSAANRDMVILALTLEPATGGLVIAAPAALATALVAAPSIAADADVPLGVASLIAASAAPSIAADATIPLPAAIVTADAPTPQRIASVGLASAVAEALADAAAPGVDAVASLPLPVAVALATAPAPVVGTTGALPVPAAGAIATVTPPVVAAEVSAGVPIASVIASVVAASPFQGISLAAPAAVILATADAPQLVPGGVVLALDVAAATVTAPAPDVDASIGLAVPTAGVAATVPGLSLEAVVELGLDPATVIATVPAAAVFAGGVLLALPVAVVDARVGTALLIDLGLIVADDSMTFRAAARPLVFRAAVRSLTFRADERSLTFRAGD